MKFVYYYKHLDQIILIDISKNGILYETGRNNFAFEEIAISFDKIVRQLDFVGFL